MPEAKKAYILLTLLPQDRLLDAESAVAILAILGYEVSVDDIRAWKREQPGRAQMIANVRVWIAAQFERAPSASAERDAWYRILRELSTISDSNISLYKSELGRQICWLLEELVVRVLTLQSIL